MAGGKANTFDSDLLKLIYNATAIANLADNAASSPFTNIYVALHTADPGVGGTQSTSEAAYTSYARVAVARTSGGWTITGETVNPVAAINFASATGGSETETWFSTGVASSGSTKILHRGPLSASIVVTSGVTPSLSTATAITES